MQYKEQFRMRAALNPTLRCDQVDLALWMQVLPFAKPNLVKLSHSGHMVQTLSMELGPHPLVGQVVQLHPVVGSSVLRARAAEKSA